MRMPEAHIIAQASPTSFKECGLGAVVLIGDCTDILTEGCNCSVVTSSEMHSDKSDHDVAMGLAWVTPCGYVAVACDLFCGRTSEQEACKMCQPVFAKIPSKYALMYDKGVAKLQVHLDQLNQVITPSFLRKQKRFSVAQGCRNRGITSNRYIAELPFARAKAWAFLGGVVKSCDAHLLNSVWWWTLGFQNLCHKNLKPPGV